MGVFYIMSWADESHMGTYTLTPRQREIAQLIAKGCSNKQVGVALCISEQSVKNHLTIIFGELGIFDRTQLAVYAIRHGLVDGAYCPHCSLS